MKKLIIAIGILTPFSMAQAAGLNIRVGEEAVAFTLQSSDPTSGSAGELALIYNEDQETTVVNAGLFVTGKRGGLTGRMGAKVYAADLDRFDGYGVALGADVSYPLGSGISLEGGLYFGPSALSFGDIDRYRHWYVGAGFALFDNAKLAAGVGSLEIESEFGNTIEVDDGVFVEMKLSF